MKNGEFIFDIVKFNRILNEDNFKIFISGYQKIKQLPSYFQERLNFYSLFDSYTSVYWSIINNKTNTNFYKLNYNIVISYLQGGKNEN